MAAERTRPTRLGLFGGSFDPPHKGHLHAARAAREAFLLDHVVFLPAARPPHKPGRRLLAGEERLVMLQLTVMEEPGFSVDGRELVRAGPSYTIDTVREILLEWGGEERVELYLIIGSDNLPGLPEWCEVEALLSLVRPVVVRREGVPREGESLEALRALEGELSAAGVQKLAAGWLDLPPVPASSTELRASLARGEDPHRLLVPEVLEHVLERGLYRREP